jgi:hypothetical protein
MQDEIVRLNKIIRVYQYIFSYISTNLDHIQDLRSCLIEHSLLPPVLPVATARFGHFEKTSLFDYCEDDDRPRVSTKDPPFPHQRRILLSSYCLTGF